LFFGKKKSDLRIASCCIFRYVARDWGLNVGIWMNRLFFFLKRN
jgi:hypothetical protein